jgi:hypothetical protein
MTDAILIVAASNGASIITADFSLYKAALDAGHDAHNFNHLRFYQ